jgi:hypothetical protein
MPPETVSRWCVIPSGRHTAVGILPIFKTPPPIILKFSRDRAWAGSDIRVTLFSVERMAVDRTKKTSEHETRTADYAAD